jgi:hypothetical protein
MTTSRRVVLQGCVIGAGIIAANMTGMAAPSISLAERSGSGSIPCRDRHSRQAA